MSSVYYAKVIIIDGSFETYRKRLADLAGPGIDIGVVQVGSKEALIRPVLLDHLKARHFLVTLDELLRGAGANRIDWIKEADAYTLYLQRINEDLEVRADVPVPEHAGGKSWHHKATDVEAAWQAVQKADGSIDWGTIRVGQLDTGYTRHKALGYGQPGGTWLREDLSKTLMYEKLPDNWVPPPPPDDGVDPLPIGGLFRGHGTRIGSTISGHADVDANFRFRGIAPRVPHVMVRITDSVAINGRQQEFADGLRYLVDVAQVKVLNVSLGIYPRVTAPVLRQALSYACSKGVIVVCAAGNHVGQMVPPASLPEAIAVAASTWQDLPWHDSSYGRKVHFSAPGAVITRPDVSDNGIGTGIAGTSGGTSYAAAITTGAAALWLLRYGSKIDARYGTGEKRVEAFRKAAIASCRTPQGWDTTRYGAGILNIGRLCTDDHIGLPPVF